MLVDQSVCLVCLHLPWRKKNLKTMKPTVLKFATKQSVKDIATKTSPRSTKTICEILESFFTSEVYIVILGVGLLQGNRWNSYDFSPGPQDIPQLWCQERFRTWVAEHPNPKLILSSAGWRFLGNKKWNQIIQKCLDSHQCTTYI